MPKIQRGGKCLSEGPRITVVRRHDQRRPVRVKHGAFNASCNVILRKLLSAHKSHVRETSLFTGAIPNPVRNSQTSLFVWCQVKIREGSFQDPTDLAIGTRQQLLRLDFALLAAQFPQFTFLTSVRDLGVTLDNTLSFSTHISNLSR